VKSLKTLILMLSLMVFGTPVYAQGGPVEPVFLQDINDIPLMPGLYEVPEEGVVFDKPEGRIVEAEAATDSIQGVDIIEFYSSALPQLGWVPEGPDSFVRQGERLRITVGERGAGRTVHFTVMPQT
jgi:hypothetical protein